jgi:hypothetical protein
MNILTVANNSYVLHAINLFLSYEKFSYNKEKILYYFDISDNKLLFIEKNIKNLRLEKIPKINDYIYNTKIFLFKTYALAEEIKKGSFIYSDSANCFVKEDNYMKNYLENNDRLLLQYPEELKKNKNFTTKKCFDVLECNSEEYKNKHQYWAGFQVYKDTEDNKNLLLEQQKYMMIKNVAYPESTVERPDGSANPCWFHRNDQSVLSLLIEKYSLTQNFSYDIFNKYGDFYTVFNHDKSFLKDFKEENIIMHARDAKQNGLRFITNSLREEYANLR